MLFLNAIDRDITNNMVEDIKEALILVGCLFPPLLTFILYIVSPRFQQPWTGCWCSLSNCLNILLYWRGG